MGEQLCQVVINNMPENVEEWIVANCVSNELWFWGSWDDKTKAEEVAREVESRLVVRRG